MQLRHGVTVDVAVKVLDDIISRSQDPYNEQFSTIDRKRTVYLNWVTAPRPSYGPSLPIPKSNYRCLNVDIGISAMRSQRPTR